jgi:hypothetical protein
MKRFVSLIICLLLSGSMYLQAQGTLVKGRVTAFNSYGLNNITVTAKKAKISVTTDEQGLFILDCAEKDVIQIQQKGFLAASRKVDPRRDTEDFNLVFKNSPKNRKLVVEMGHISKDDLAYGINNLGQENNDYCSYPDIFALIQSKFPEVEVRSGSAGGRGIYLRRGAKTLTGDSQMLYIVDGQRLQDISYINTCEIAVIRVLTEGAAAKYGAGSSNGALEIITKKPV